MHRSCSLSSSARRHRPDDTNGNNTTPTNDPPTTTAIANAASLSVGALQLMNMDVAQPQEPCRPSLFQNSSLTKKQDMLLPGKSKEKGGIRVHHNHQPPPPPPHLVAAEAADTEEASAVLMIPDVTETTSDTTVSESAAAEAAISGDDDDPELEEGSMAAAAAAAEEVQVVFSTPEHPYQPPLQHQDVSITDLIDRLRLCCASETAVVHPSPWDEEVADGVAAASYLGGGGKRDERNNGDDGEQTEPPPSKQIMSIFQMSELLHNVNDRNQAADDADGDASKLPLPPSHEPLLPVSELIDRLVQGNNHDQAENNIPSHEEQQPQLSSSKLHRALTLSSMSNNMAPRQRLRGGGGEGRHQRVIMAVPEMTQLLHRINQEAKASAANQQPHREKRQQQHQQVARRTEASYEEEEEEEHQHSIHRPKPPLRTTGKSMIRQVKSMGDAEYECDHYGDGMGEEQMMGHDGVELGHWKDLYHPSSSVKQYYCRRRRKKRKNRVTVARSVSSLSLDDFLEDREVDKDMWLFDSGGNLNLDSSITEWTEEDYCSDNDKNNNPNGSSCYEYLTWAEGDDDDDDDAVADSDNAQPSGKQGRREKKENSNNRIRCRQDRDNENNDDDQWSAFTLDTLEDHPNMSCTSSLTWYDEETIADEEEEMDEIEEDVWQAILGDDDHSHNSSNNAHYPPPDNVVCHSSLS